MLNLNLHRSRSGLPCLWECGGGYTNTGSAAIITDKNGYPKRAIHVRTHGDLSNGNHALIPVTVGDKVVVAETQRDKTAVKVLEITAIHEAEADFELCNTPIAEDAIMAAIAKARHYHCRRPFYIKEKQRQWYQEVAGDGSQTAWQKILCKRFSTTVKNGAVKQGGIWLKSPCLRLIRECAAVCAPQA